MYCSVCGVDSPPAEMTECPSGWRCAGCEAHARAGEQEANVGFWPGVPGARAVRPFQPLIAGIALTGGALHALMSGQHDTDAAPPTALVVIGVLHLALVVWRALYRPGL